jgi:hypothetical protein
VLTRRQAPPCHLVAQVDRRVGSRMVDELCPGVLREAGFPAVRINTFRKRTSAQKWRSLQESGQTGLDRQAPAQIAANSGQLTAPPAQVRSTGFTKASDGGLAQSATGLPARWRETAAN